MLRWSMLSGILRKMDGLLSQAWWTPLPSRCSPETITRNRGRREGLDLMLSTHRCNVLEYDLGGRDARAHPLMFHPCSRLITSDYCGANVYILIPVCHGAHRGQTFFVDSHVVIRFQRECSGWRGELLIARHLFNKLQKTLWYTTAFNTVAAPIHKSICHMLLNKW